MGIISSLLAALGLSSANAGSQACHWVFWDEPKCPKSLIK